MKMDADKVKAAREKLDKAEEEAAATMSLDAAIHASVIELNKELACVRWGGKTVFIDMSKEPQEWDRIPLLDEKGLRLYYANKPIWGKVADDKGGVHDKAVGRFTEWVKHRERREYSDLVLDHTDTRPDVLNLWQGFKVAPVKGDWATLKDFLFDVFCAGDAAKYGPLMRLLAWKVRNPTNHVEVVLCLPGGEGIGKGTFMRLMRSWFSPVSVVESSNAEHLFGRFADWPLRALVVAFNEAVFAPDGRQNGRVKHMITEPDLDVEVKFGATLTVRNKALMVIMGNNDRLVQVSPDSRRNFILTPSDSRRGDKPYWNGVHAAIKGDESAALLHHLLHEVELPKDYHPRGDVPVTAELVSQRVMSMGPVETWLDQVAQQGHFEGWNGAYHLAKLALDEYHPKHDIYASFLHWHQTDGRNVSGSRHIGTEIFWRHIKNAIGIDTSKTGVHSYRPRTDAGAQVHLVYLPPGEFIAGALVALMSSGGKAAPATPPKNTAELCEKAKARYRS